jgi:hypothetical protein
MIIVCKQWLTIRVILESLANLDPLLACKNICFCLAWQGVPLLVLEQRCIGCLSYPRALCRLSALGKMPSSKAVRAVVMTATVKGMQCSFVQLAL